VSLGIPTHVLGLAAGLVQAGWEVDVACPDGPEVAMLAPVGVGHVPVSFSRVLNPAAHLRTLAKLVGVLRRGRYDVVHLHGPIPSTIGRIAGRLAGTRTIVHVRGTFFSEPPDMRFGGVVKAAYPLLERALVPATDALVVLTEQDGRDMTARVGHAAERVTVTHVGGCGIDLAEWDPSRFDAEARARTRRELGIPEGVPVIGFIGRLVRQKGVLELIDAFHILREQGVEAHLLIIGDVHPSERDHATAVELRARVARYGLERHVSLPGYLRPVTPAFAVMDVFVLPSHREGIAQSMLEAGAMGLPVVGAACRGIRAAVIDGVTGVLVPVEAPAELAAAIGRVLAEPELARRLGEAGRERALRLYGRDQFLRSMINVYERVLAR
jgi:glycosyltransferase involved in cell wall biosynthesis